MTPTGVYEVYTAGNRFVGFAKLQLTKRRFRVACASKLTGKGSFGDNPFDVGHEDRLQVREVEFELVNETIYIRQGSPSWLRGEPWFRMVSLPKRTLSV